MPGDKKGFVIILVVAFLAILLLVGWTIIDIGCGEILQTKSNCDMALAHYLAMSGAEMMYLNLSSKESQDLTWGELFQTVTGSVSVKQSNGQTLTVGSYSASAGQIDADEFGIISTGTAPNNRAAVSRVKYFYTLNNVAAIPIGSMAAMELYGRRLLLFRSWVRAQGPLESSSTITTNSYVQVTGDINQNQSFQPISFWLSETAKTNKDTNNDGNYITDNDGDGLITTGDIPLVEGAPDPASLAVFNNDNTYTSDGQVNDKDAFVYYYTVYLDNAANNSLGQDLNISPGDTMYYSGNQTFTPSSIPAGTPIIFVDGNADILFSDTTWWGADSNHTIVATGNINITQPTNGNDDILTLVSYGDVNTGGVRALGGVRGDLIIYAKGDFNAYYGGRTDGTIFAEGNVYVDTVLPIPGLLNRDLNRGSIDWMDSTTLPLGLPPGYEDNVVQFRFIIEEDVPAHKAVWQRN